MRIYLCFISLWCLTSCLAQKNSWVGATEEKNLSKEFKWFSQGYASYNPDSIALVELKAKLPAYTMLVFGGTWCGDTKMLLPSFYKTAELSGLSQDKIDLYLLDDGKSSPKGLEEKYDIQAIPVFILLENGKEVGRIVETVDESIEKDLLKLIKRK